MILTLLDGKKIFINLRTKVIKTIFETEEGTAIDFTDFSQHIVKETFAQVVKKRMYEDLRCFNRCSTN